MRDRPKIGVLGGGQLGRMLALSGYPLGLRFQILDPSPEASAGQVAPLVAGGFEDMTAIREFERGLDVVTYEFENVPLATANYLAENLPVYPPPKALEISQDRLSEKTFFQRLGIPTPTFAPVFSLADLEAAATLCGLPAVLKTRREGYDGKGQRVLRDRADLEPAWRALGEKPLILESFVPFDREVSIIAVRSLHGETRFYPLAENQHREGILRLSLSPAERAPQALAEGHARRALEAMDYVGVLTIEFFEVNGELLANEMAPRVHNSGHATIEGSETSQFENHLRAILGLPLGSTAPRGVSAMINLIGWLPEPRDGLGWPGVHLHVYGKEPRPGRKVGHVTLRCDTHAELDPLLAATREKIKSDG